jgi:response regulator RpfG family c-di-GMP phosphodiesterase
MLSFNSDLMGMPTWLPRFVTTPGSFYHDCLNQPRESNMPLVDEPLAVTLVDDEPAVLGILAHALSKWRYPTQVASSAEEAIGLLDRHPTPLLVTDLTMPGRGGLWLVEEVRARWPDTVILVMTGGRKPEEAASCLNAGANRYLLKPFDLDEFRAGLTVAGAMVRNQRQRRHFHRLVKRKLRKQAVQIRSTFLSGIDSLVLALEARDPFMAGHSDKVRLYAVALGEVVGLSEKDIRKLSFAARLHDIGKVAVSQSILHKPTELTDEEHLAIQSHPVVGEEILRPIIHSKTILSAIRNHHERYDGEGYPDGLAGKAIPYLARIISVADCFDALTSPRPYRYTPLSVTEACQVLRKLEDTQLDGFFARTFVDLLRREPALAEQ